MSVINLVTIAKEYQTHNKKCLQLPSESYFRILREEDDYEVKDIYIDSSISRELKQIIEDDVRLTYDQQLFKIFNYDSASLKLFFDNTKKQNNHDLFEQTITNKAGNNKSIQNLIRSCWVNPFLIVIVDHKTFQRYHLHL